MTNRLSMNELRLSHELELLLKFLGPEVKLNQKRIFDNETDLKLFLELSKHHRVFPLIYCRFKTVKLNEKYPELFSIFTRLYQNNSFKMLKLSGELVNVTERFTEAGIKLLHLKGPVLASYLHNDLSLRTSSDLDMLVPIEDLDCADKLLEDMGYMRDEYFSQVLNDWKWRHHHYSYYHPERKTKVELHWRLHPGPGIDPAFSELWDRKQQSNLYKSGIFYLGKEDLLLFLATHGSRHGWSRIGWLVDIDRLIQKELDWSTVKTLSKKYGSTHIVGQSLILASKFFQTPLNKDMNSFMYNNRAIRLANAADFYLKQMVNLHMDPLPIEISKYHRGYLFDTMSMQRKLLFLLSLLYPYPGDTETLILPEKLYFLYFPLRPFLCIWRRTKKQSL